MADSAKVRLVRCPKCENLLPELADYSVYQCGGCGAVLRAKAKRQESENSDEEMVGLASARLENSLEKRAVDSVTSDSNVKAISGSFRRDHGQDNSTQSKVDKDCVVENGLNTSMERRDKSGRDLNSELSSRIDSRRSGRMMNWKIGSGGEVEEFGRSVRADVESVRFSTSNHHDEGTSKSNYQSGPSHGFGGTLKKHGSQESSRAHYLEQDRVALLKKLDELRDQISRSCEVSDKEKAPDSHGGSDSWSNRPYIPYNRPDKHAVGSPNFSRFADPVAYNNGYEIPTHSFHPSIPYSNHTQGYGDPFGPQIHKGGSHHFPRPYQQPTNPYFSGQYMDNNPDPFEPYSHNATFHHSSCACFHCYEKRRRASATIPSPSFGNNPMLYRHENHGVVVGPSDPNKSKASLHHTRWPSDPNHDVGHGRARGRRVLHAGGRLCQPVSGGAPFLSCSNCFEVLKFPKKVPLVENTKCKLKCGACSTIMDLAIVDKKFVLSVNSEVTNGYNGVAENGTLYSNGHMNRSFVFSSDDYDNSGYDFQAMDREPVSLQVGPSFPSGKPQETQSLHSSSACTSEDDNSLGIPIPVKTNLSPPPPGSPLQDHFDYSTDNCLANRLGKGNQSCRSDQEKVKPNKITSRQNSLNKASLATEMEVSFNEYSNTGISHDSGDAIRPENPVRINKGSESFFSNMIKKSFKDFSRSNPADEGSKTNITVNGHSITDRVLKKARKLAGSIHPGNYWYDYRAGFWGIIGGPCLGIIIPYIEEFNYPMPENCAGGTTGIYVNGRELHQKDLDLLSSRGLPTSRDRSYIVEISGRVLDEDTGEELDCLGKLAPTVEKAKHGFGMKAPKVVKPDQSS